MWILKNIGKLRKTQICGYQSRGGGGEGELDEGGQKVQTFKGK